MRKISYYINHLAYIKKLRRSFGYKIAFNEFRSFYIFRGTTSKGKASEQEQYKAVVNYLKTKFSYLIDEYKLINVDNITNISEDSIIWIFWWQYKDMNSVPLAVNQCISSIKKHAGKHKVQIVCKDNVKQYLDLPPYYFEKLRSGQFNVTHFSDILRAELLSEYGGIWLDASFFITKDFPKDLSDHSFYTLRHGLFSEYHVCKGLWTDGFFAVGKNNPLMCFLRDFFRKYWETENTLIAYLLIDSIIALAYENYKWARDMIDAVPINNSEYTFFDQHGNDLLDIHTFEETISNNYIFRIHFRKKFISEKRGEQTYYGKLIDEFSR